MTETGFNRDSLTERVEKLEQKLDVLIQKLDSVKDGTDKMSTHIDFINNIYTHIRHPLFWICDRVNYMRGYNLTCTEKQLVKEKPPDINEQD